MRALPAPSKVSRLMREYQASYCIIIPPSLPSQRRMVLAGSSPITETPMQSVCALRMVLTVSVMR